ncbi:MAG: hypothetical protein ACJ70U_08610 [Nitrososphaera sp.]
MVFSIYDSTEVAVQKMIEASQRMIKLNTNSDSNLNENNKNQRIGERGESATTTIGSWRGMNPAIKRHLELQINTLQNAPRDAGKLERLLKTKRRQKEEATELEHAESLVTEIEMLKVVLFLVCRKIKEEEEGGGGGGGKI